jgi:rhamnulokinase
VTGAVAAVDLGATSGRVMLGFVGNNELDLRPIARFPNGPVSAADGLHWNITGVYDNVLNGLAAAIREAPELVSIGVDTWAVDYALLRSGRMLGEPFHYRDDRNLPAVDAVHAVVSAEDLYATNGLQQLPFNTLFQLAADRDSGALASADSMLLIPDLINFWLTGRSFAELSNASTTGLLNVATRTWDDTLIERLGLRRELFAPLIAAGSTVGGLTAQVAEQIGAGPALTVTAVGSHDTASAVAAIPSVSDDFAYISCGTWGLVGVELERPILSEAGRLANFTNEGGVDSRVRFLHNVMGLWLLSETVRSWQAAGETVELSELLAQAASVTEKVPTFDANDPVFLAPGDLPARIAEWFGERGIAAPTSRATTVRCIIESLAIAFARAIEQARELSGKRISVIHLVGGGSLNTLLCQLTADHTGLPVIAGPVEATAIGNVLIQARAQGLVAGDLESLRAIVARASRQLHYLPRRAAGTT